MPSLRIHYFQHVPFEGIACIEDWINLHNYKVSSTRFYDNQLPPAMEEFDWLIIMGGPMGVYDEEKFPWLKTEKAFIRDAIAHNKTVIGICLGAQLIAAALDAKVYPNKHKEIGWFPIENPNRIAEINPAYQIPKEFTVFHWHGDTFDLPQGAVHLFRSEACLNQGFLYQDNVVALQFHFEANPQSVLEMVNHGEHEINAGGPFIQNRQYILENKEFYKASNDKIFEILDYFRSKHKL
jgi:GMP synthase-like glutamine amidotransferase